jgi:hypothetical protein
MSQTNRSGTVVTAAVALLAAWCGGGCAEHGHDVVARQGSYELRDRDIKQSVLTANLDAGDRARIDYMGHQPVRASVDRHYVAGANHLAGWQWLALDSHGRYEWRGEGSR